MLRDRELLQQKCKQHALYASKIDVTLTAAGCYGLPGIIGRSRCFSVGRGNSRTKGHLKLAGEHGTPADSEELTTAANQASREAALAKLLLRFGQGDTYRRIVIAAEALKQKAPLWFTETFGNRIGRVTTAGVVTEYSIWGALGAARLRTNAGRSGCVGRDGRGIVEDVRGASATDSRACGQ